MTPKRKAVAALVNYNGRILMGRKKAGSEGFLSDKWHIPGETLEEGETDEEGLIRGVMEEAGIKIKVGKYLASHRTPKHTLVRWYECEPLTYDIQAGSDLSEVKWVLREEVMKMCHDRAKSLWPQQIEEYFKL